MVYEFLKLELEILKKNWENRNSITKWPTTRGLISTHSTCTLVHFFFFSKRQIVIYRGMCLLLLHQSHHLCQVSFEEKKKNILRPGCACTFWPEKKMLCRAIKSASLKLSSLLIDWTVLIQVWNVFKKVTLYQANQFYFKSQVMVSKHK